jgi:DNA-binding NarL/FixJ family response regulator
VNDTADKIRVMLIDDHAVVREGLRAVLEDFTDLDVVGEAASGSAALLVVEQIRPDVVISDLRMPGISAVEAIRSLRKLMPATQIVVFSSFADAPQVRAVLEAGAIGYLTKDALAAELHHAVLAAHKGIPCVHPNVRAILREAEMLPDVALILSKLAPRERDVLSWVAKAKSNKEIARELGLTEGTVKGYVSAIFEKLKVNDRTQAALIALNAGLSDG